MKTLILLLCSLIVANEPNCPRDDTMPCCCCAWQFLQDDFPQDWEPNHIFVVVVGVPDVNNMIFKLNKGDNENCWFWCEEWWEDGKLYSIELEMVEEIYTEIRIGRSNNPFFIFWGSKTVDCYFEPDANDVLWRAGDCNDCPMEYENTMGLPYPEGRVVIYWPTFPNSSFPDLNEDGIINWRDWACWLDFTNKPSYIEIRMFAEQWLLEN